MDPHFDGIIFQTHAEELQRRMAFDYPPCAVLDVSSPDSSTEPIPGSITVSLDSLESSLPEGTTPETEFIVVGEDLNDAATRQVSNKLRDLGAKRVVEMPGGLREWHDAGFGTKT